MLFHYRGIVSVVIRPSSDMQLCNCTLHRLLRTSQIPKDSRVRFTRIIIYYLITAIVSTCLKCACVRALIFVRRRCNNVDLTTAAAVTHRTLRWIKLFCYSYFTAVVENQTIEKFNNELKGENAGF